MRTVRFLGAMALIITMSAATGCRGGVSQGDFTQEELSLINGVRPAGIPEGTMRVLTIEDSLDNAVLRAASTDLSRKALLSDDYKTLERLMVATVTHPSQDGVGIAGPQVGLNRRVVAVQRFDKPGEPFEVYPNIRIIWYSDSLEYGPEGCLSVPNRRGQVLRSREIVIEYADSASRYTSTVRDTVQGFTAVIFQHETDHLDGILYTDRL